MWRQAFNLSRSSWKSVRSGFDLPLPNCKTCGQPGSTWAHRLEMSWEHPFFCGMHLPNERSLGMPQQQGFIFLSCCSDTVSG